MTPEVVSELVDDLYDRNDPLIHEILSRIVALVVTPPESTA